MPRGRAPGYALQREHILATAADLFARQGYSATSMNEVATACGVSKPALYHYVRDKYQLLVEIAQGHVDRLQVLVDHAPATDDAHARVRGLIASFLAVYASSQAAHRVLTTDVRFLSPADRERILDGQRRVVGAFAEAVAAARPELRDGDLHRTLTMLLFGMINWMFTWHRADGRLSHAELAPIVTDLFFGGLVAVHTVAAAHALPSDLVTL